jgi:hypothetical protein
MVYPYRAAMGNNRPQNEPDTTTAPWTAERAEKWWAAHLPGPADTRPMADVLLSHEGRQRRIGPRVRPRG